MEEADMDFIEKLFGFAPDGGSGALEAALFIVPIVALSVMLIVHGRRGLPPGR
jgi:hypothetical protein